MTSLPASMALLPAEGRAQGSSPTLDPPHSVPVGQFENRKRRKTMQSFPKSIRLGVAALAVAAMLAGASPISVAFAQATPPAPTAALPAATVTALQAALNKQGIAVKADGVLNDETRAAIKKYQTQHHLPVTGEPDKATLDKLGVAARQGTTPAQSPVLAQATPPPPAGSPPPQALAPAPGQMVPGQAAQGGMMMNCPMMQGAMPGMMQMMQGMMQMMQTMQVQPGQMMQMQPGQKQPMQGTMQGTMQGMMQMMQGMMQMMQMMQGGMQPQQMQPGSR